MLTGRYLVVFLLNYIRLEMIHGTYSSYPPGHLILSNNDIRKHEIPLSDIFFSSVDLGPGTKILHYISSKRLDLLLP